MRDAPAGWLDYDPARGDRAGQIYRAVRERVLAGDLPGGARLPPTRRLAATLGVARSTVVAAYERLRAEGYLTSAGGSATLVAAMPRTCFPDARSRAAAAAAAAARSEPRRSVLFKPGLPDLTEFPHRAWARCLAARARSARLHDLSYDEGSGIAALREAIIGHVAAARGVIGAPDQVVVVPSARAAAALLARCAIGPSGATVWMEEPGYPTARELLRDAGGRITPVPVDGEGMAPSSAHPEPALIYVTPSHQYPAGVTMSLSRRLALIERARRAGALIVEDDYDSEFLEGPPIAALQSIDRAGVVAYVGTFSKALAPGLRAAFAVLPRRLVAPVERQQALWGCFVPVPVQAALADFVRDGHLRAHVRRMGAVYRRNGRALRDAIDRGCGGLVDLGPCVAGLQLPVWFRDAGLDDVAACCALAARGFGVEPLSAHYAGRPRPGILAGAATAAANADAFARALGETLACLSARETASPV